MKLKKGFTMVELVIVIAVIAILAGILIPVFANVIEKANINKSLQQARNALKLYLTENADNLTGQENYIVFSGNCAFEVIAGQFVDEAIPFGTTDTPDDNTDITVNESKMLDVKGKQYYKWPTAFSVSRPSYAEVAPGIYCLYNSQYEIPPIQYELLTIQYELPPTTR